MFSTQLAPAVISGDVLPHNRARHRLAILARRKNLPLKKRGKAYSLIEILLGTIAAIGIMSVVFVYFNTVNTSQAAKKQTDYFASIMADVRGIYANQGNYNGVNPAALINLGIVPATMVRNDIMIAEGWNTVVDVAPTNLNGTAGDGIEFSYTLPRSVCAKFASTSAPLAARVTVDGTIIKNVATGNNNVDVNQMQSACQSSAGGNVVVLLAQGR